MKLFEMKTGDVRLRWALAVALGMGLTAEGAVFRLGDNGRPLRWNIDTYDVDLEPEQNPVTLAIRFHLVAEGWSAANRARELDNIRSAFAQWQAIPGIRVKFEEGTPVTGVKDVDANDFQNTVVWLPGDRFINQGHTYFSDGLAGVTVLTGSQTDETIAEADIVLNSNRQWTTELNPQSVEGTSLEAVALHEIGHLLGLNHSPLGGATLFFQTPGGHTSALGLSTDDTGAALSLYGDAATLKSRATLSGGVKMGGVPVLGAIVTVEDASGLVLSATATHADGGYQLPGLTPGPVQVRVTPLDPASGGTGVRLVGGAELDTSDRVEYLNSNTAFLPTPNQSLTLTAGGTLTKDFAVTAGTPPFRIGKTRRLLTPEDRTSGNICVQLSPGQTNAWIGVYVPGFSGTSAELRVTGDGLTVGPTLVTPNALASMALIQAPVDVSVNASPGLRSLSVTSGGYTAWANGFAEVVPLVLDYNFDGLDDLFQRRFWSPFTRAEAAPDADPDDDGFVNRREYRMGSDPTNPASVNYRITRVKMDSGGTTITWESAPGRRYQVYRRATVAGGPTWVPVGPVVVAPGETSQLLDPQVGEILGFYQVRDAQ